MKIQKGSSHFFWYLEIDGGGFPWNFSNQSFLLSEKRTWLQLNTGIRTLHQWSQMQISSQVCDFLNLQKISFHFNLNSWWTLSHGTETSWDTWWRFWLCLKILDPPKIFLEMASFKAGNKKTWDFPRGSNFETKPRLKKPGFPELVIHVAIF